MTFILVALMFYCLFGVAKSLWHIRVVNMSLANLNNIKYLAQTGIINDIQFKVYMNEFEDGGYKSYATQVNLARELNEIYEQSTHDKRNGFFRPN